jgi:hypothetical protein
MVEACVGGLHTKYGFITRKDAMLVKPELNRLRLQKLQLWLYRENNAEHYAHKSELRTSSNTTRQNDFMQKQYQTSIC